MGSVIGFHGGQRAARSTPDAVHSTVAPRDRVRVSASWSAAAGKNGVRLCGRGGKRRNAYAAMRAEEAERGGLGSGQGALKLAKVGHSARGTAWAGGVVWGWGCTLGRL